MTTESLAQLVELLPEPTLLTTPAGVVLTASRAAGSLGLGPVADLHGRSLAELAEGGPESVVEYLRLCARSREFLPGMLRLRGADGTRLSIRARGASLRPEGADGRAILLLRLVPGDQAETPFLALNQKIEELSAEIARRRRAERELVAQRRWLEVTLTSIGDAVIAADGQGRITLMNPVAERLTGWPQAEACGRPTREVLPIVDEATGAPQSDPVEQVLESGRPVGLSNHALLVARDGSRRPIDDAAAPIREPSGPLQGVVMIFRDVTERRALEVELRRRAESLAEADRHKNEFLAVLAHELRNPLAAISNTLEGADLDTATPEALAWSTSLMRRQVRHLARMVDDLLDLSRLNFGRIELRRVPTDLAGAIREALELIRPMALARLQSLSVELPDEPLVLDADPTRLEQILWNLLSNALKYTGDGGHIRISARPDGELVELSVTDDGVGIAPELLPRVFELFTQADKSLAHTKGGLGIGLTLVRTLVSLHGGTVAVSSPGAGRGSTFTVRLPRSAAAPAAGRDASPRAAAPGRGRRVLIVDDVADSADSLARILRAWGNQVAVAYEGHEALQRVRELRPDTVLLDLGMPGLDGLQIARHLHSEDGGMLRPARLIALTGYGQAEDRRRTEEAGFDDHLVKPADIEVLRRLFGPEPADPD